MLLYNSLVGLRIYCVDRKQIRIRWIITQDVWEIKTLRYSGTPKGKKCLRIDRKNG